MEEKIEPTQRLQEYFDIVNQLEQDVRAAALALQAALDKYESAVMKLRAAMAVG